ncbi:3-deoxy-7-phosphoheptulonate synthase class II [Hydrocarboniphaga effusa]|uniref:3-deoxy-7-phosphoheptulonate synthase class II n=1 Tax=Hydrocarboniphaga effusa TaxID=243629 RepID=UPI0031384940
MFNESRLRTGGFRVSRGPSSNELISNDCHRGSGSTPGAKAVFNLDHDVITGDSIAAADAASTPRRRSTDSGADAWHPQSWKAHPIRQAPEYPDADAHARVIAQLRQLPPLVLADEVRALKAQLARVAHGEALLLQGGDCAESFAEFSASSLRDTHRALREMAIALSTHLPVVTVGRIAGQFAKPRSSAAEKIGDVELPSYRGDIVNGPAFDAQSRAPDPQRMLRAYQQSAITLNLLRALDGASIARQSRLYTSHEALLLPYEAASTHRDSVSGDWYDCSAHLLWIGDRTRELGGAHLEFCRGIANPLGLKCGPSMTPDELLRVLDVLDPRREPGRITLISRMGADGVRDQLPALVRALQREGRPAVWICDPMHGNTQTATGGYKTRPFERVAEEVRGYFEVHRALGSHAGGLHLEMTGKNVTECTGGPQRLSEQDLPLRYQTHCDPRLNAVQALALAAVARSELASSQAANTDKARRELPQSPAETEPLLVT